MLQQQLVTAFPATVTAKSPVALPAAALKVYEMALSWGYCDWKNGICTFGFLFGGSLRSLESKAKIKNTMSLVERSERKFNVGSSSLLKGCRFRGV